MPKSRLVNGIIASGLLLSVSPGIGQDTPGPATPTPPAAAVPSATPLPDVLTSVPDAGSSPPAAVTPVPGTPPPITPPPNRDADNAKSAVTSSTSFQWSEAGAPVFTIDKAVITALQQNPDLLRALHEIERTKGVIIQVRAEALPQIRATGNLSWTDPNLSRSGT